jgi:hypothetical protein
LLSHDDLKAQRFAVRDALTELQKMHSDRRIESTLADYLAKGLIPGFPNLPRGAISRATIQRIRTSDDESLVTIRPRTIGVLHAFLCHCPELKTDLFKAEARINSAHALAPLLASLLEHVGATDGPLTNRKLKSLEGDFVLYRKAWTSPHSDTYVSCLLRFTQVGDAMFYSEEQKFHDTVTGVEIDEVDHGVVLPFGMNVVLIGRGENKDLLKFFSFHDLSPFPDGVLPTAIMGGNFIAVYNKGPHPGYKAYARREKPEDRSLRFYGPGELDPTIARILKAET